jgi:hypothetical protein
MRARWLHGVIADFEIAAPRGAPAVIQFQTRSRIWSMRASRLNSNPGFGACQQAPLGILKNCYSLNR